MDIGALNRHVPTKGTNMGIDIGTIGKRYVTPDTDNPDRGFFPCARYNPDFEDDTHNLRQCVGMVIDIDDSDEFPLTVQWLQMCNYHRKVGIQAQTRTDPYNFWKIGQM